MTPDQAKARALRGLVVLLTAAAMGVALPVGADAPPGERDPLAPPRMSPQPPAAQVAPYVATPMPVVNAMLSLAKVGPGDFVVDLGSGDGRLVLAAVSVYGARGGLGVDLDETLVRYANNLANEAGVAERARFHTRDLFETDVHEATVVTVYLLPGVMGRLEAKLLAELAPGARVVVHDYPFPGWRSDRVMSFDVPEKNDYTGRRSTSLYLYTVPARAGRGTT